MNEQIWMVPTTFKVMVPIKFPSDWSIEKVKTSLEISSRCFDSEIKDALDEHFEISKQQGFCAVCTLCDYDLEKIEKGTSNGRD